MRRYEYPAGTRQLIVAYLSDDDGDAVDLGALLAFIADDAAALDADGWQIVSTNSLPIRQTGTAGNILFQSGGQYATQVAMGVVYGRR
jgi:hypothetical protein